MSSYFYGLNNSINESFIKSEDDIYYNKDKFDSGEINLCFITGLSGSGKSTMSRSIKDKITVDLDKIIMYNYKDDDFFKAEGPILYGFIKGPGAKYHISKEEKEEQIKNPAVISKMNKSILNDILKYTISYANSHKDKKIVVDGVWLFIYCNPADFDKYAVYIKGTSALIAGKRAAKRGSNDDEASKSPLFKAAYAAGRIIVDFITEAFGNLNKWRKYYKAKLKKTVNESILIENTVKNPDIEKVQYVKAKDGSINACVKYKGYDKLLRGRSELLIIKGDEIFLLKGYHGFCSSKKMRYEVPGGGWDPGEAHDKSAKREAQEEALINVSDATYCGKYITYHDKPMAWVKDNIPNKSDWWYGYYTEVYIGKYAGKYSGKVAEEDKDSDMAENGKFYKIDDVYDKLHYSHKKAIDTYRGNNK